MSDTENKPTIDDILVQWFYDHGKRFRLENRVEAISELVDILVYYGYSRGFIEGARKKIMEYLVGPSSPRGTKGLVEWKAICTRDLNFVLASKFSPVRKPTEPVSIPFDAANETVIEATSKEIEQNYNEEALDSDIEQSVEYNSSPVIRPTLDRSKFETVHTTPIMSDEEFFAVLEREDNER